MMKAAAASNDVSTLISLIASASNQTPADFIKKTVGAVLFVYYMYLDKFRQRPLDIDDLIDGLLYLDAKAFVTEQQMAEHKRQMEKKKK